MKTRWLVIAATALALGIAGSANAAGDAAAGKAKASSCKGCHGKKGEGTEKNGPSLVKLSESQIAKALRDFKSGARKSKKMKPIAKRLSSSDIANLAAYWGSL